MCSYLWEEMHLGPRLGHGDGPGVGWDKGKQAAHVSRTWPGDSREGVGVEIIQDLLAFVMRPWDFTLKDVRPPEGSVQSGGII